MKIKDAIHRLTIQDRKGQQVFTQADLRIVFREDSPKTLRAGLNRLTDAGILKRAGHGVFVNMLSTHSYIHTLESIASAMREGEYNYISLESALSEWGVISQIPMRLTVMTIGRKGEFHTPFGTIEFTHTSRSLADILEDIHHVDRPLRMAGKHKAFRDLKRVGRNLDLIDEEVLYEESPD